MDVSKPEELEEIWRKATKEAKKTKAALSAQSVPKPKQMPPVVKSKKVKPPPSPIVARIMEMGFERYQIEYAIRLTGLWLWLWEERWVWLWEERCVWLLGLNWV